jgi:crossover junction endodeoxyribonuclease RusA
VSYPETDGPVEASADVAEIDLMAALGASFATKPQRFGIPPNYHPPGEQMGPFTTTPTPPEPVAVTFDVPGIPAPQGSMKGFARGDRVIMTSDNERLKPWRAVVALSASQAATAPFTGPVSLTLHFRLPVPKSAPKRRRLYAMRKPDVDKLARGAMDALTGIVFIDDAQVVHLLATKELAYERPVGLTVRCQEMP